jgi:hypothetical protein
MKLTILIIINKNHKENISLIHNENITIIIIKEEN